MLWRWYLQEYPCDASYYAETNQGRQGEVRNKYYIHLPDGKYGRIDFYLLPYNGVFTVQSVINQTGSRNLEPK